MDLFMEQSIAQLLKNFSEAFTVENILTLSAASSGDRCFDTFLRWIQAYVMYQMARRQRA
jgi:hypothetical protein